MVPPHQAAMSPSLAGIVNDPAGGGRVVPTSQRADGSVRKERRVKPGHVPNEDVAKYRPGQGNLRAQHAAAQAANAAPPSPSPAPAAARRPSPSDFLADRQQQQAASSSSATLAVPPSPTKASKAGASSSRWAVSTPEPVVPAPAVAPPMPLLAPPSPNPNKSKSSRSRKQGKQPTDTASASSAPGSPGGSTEDEQDAFNKPSSTSLQPAAPISAPPSPNTSIPELPSMEGGDWWAEDDDNEVDAAAKALQGMDIKGAPSKPKSGETLPTARQTRRSPRNGNADSAPPAALSIKTHAPRSPQKEPARPRKQDQPPRAAQPKAAAQKLPAADLFSRLGPPVPVQQVPAPQAPTAVPAAAPSSVSAAEPAPPPSPSSVAVTNPQVKAPRAIVVRTAETLGKLTIADIRQRSRMLSDEIRQIKQLKRYAAAGAVLSKDQQAQIDGLDMLVHELDELKDTSESLAQEVMRLYELSK